MRLRTPARHRPPGCRDDGEAAACIGRAALCDRSRRPASPPRTLRLAQRADGGLDGLEDLARGDQGGHGVVVGVQRTVFGQVGDVAPHDLVRGAHALARA